MLAELGKTNSPANLYKITENYEIHYVRNAVNIRKANSGGCSQDLNPGSLLWNIVSSFALHLQLEQTPISMLTPLTLYSSKRSPRERKLSKK